jgi:hypothetical protein
MRPPPANAICLGGPCHGKVVHIDQVTVLHWNHAVPPCGHP